MQFIHYTRGRDLVAFCGDLNTYPSNIELKLFSKCLELEDFFLFRTNEEDTHTCDNKGNSFGKKTPKRIDHMFVSPKASCGYAVAEQQYCHVMKDPIPGKEYNYSDHLGIQVNMKVVKDEAAALEILGDFHFIDSGKEFVHSYST